MTANARKMANPPSLGTVPQYRAHVTQQTQFEKSIGDGASSGDYSGGASSDEPIDRASLGKRQYARPFGFEENTNG